MTTVYLAPTFGVGYQSFTNGGLPNNAGYINTYIAGGTTPQATYTTSAGNVQNANPIVLDASGRPPSEIWLISGDTYRFDLYDSLGNLIKSYDNISGIGDGLANYLPLAGGTMSGTLNMGADIVMAASSVIEAEGAAVTAAATTNIWATDGNTIHVTGNTGITSFGTAPQAGAWMKLIFDGTPLLTQSANLNLNAGGANVQIAADDMAFVYADTTTQLDVFVTRKSGAPLIIGNGTVAAGSLDGAQTSGPPIFAARAWAIINGSTAGSYSPTLPSGNVSNVTRNGVGDYSFTFVVNMPDAEYLVEPSQDTVITLGISQSLPGFMVLSKSTSVLRLQFFDYAGTTNTATALDPTRCGFTVYR